MSRTAPARPAPSRAASVLAAAALMFLLAGCGSSVEEAEVEEQIRSQLGADTADCPEDLDATVGAAMTCAAGDDGGPFDVTVTVTAVEGDTANFDIERIGPVPVAGADVAQSVFDQLTAQIGQPPDEVRCPNLEAEVGASQRCELDADGATFGVTVTVTSVNGDDVNFDILVDDAPL